MGCRLDVYKRQGEDRVKQAVSEFKGMDGKFRDNVILQSKNCLLYTSHQLHHRRKANQLYGQRLQHSLLPEFIHSGVLAAQLQEHR